MTMRFAGRLFRSRSAAGQRRERARAARPPRRPLQLQSLESRRLLAAYINELMVDPLFESSDGNQYLELRSEPNTMLPQGTYFLAVNERGLGGLGGSVGVIQTVFDLSGQTVGSNGMLVLLQQDSPFPLSPVVGTSLPQPVVLRSTDKGFSGLPGEIYSSLSAAGRFDQVTGSAGYFLIQSDVAPQLGEDIDVDDDGVIDPEGVAAHWTIFDSISLHHGVYQGSVAYGQVAYIEKLTSSERVVIAAPGVEVVHTPGFGYAARIGDSTGHTSADWAVGTVRDRGTGSQVVDFQFETGSLGAPIPPVFAGRSLNHLGESNFIGGVRGKLIEQFEDEDGELTSGPFVGVSFLADTNGNGARDLLTHVVEPNDFVSGTTLTNTFPGVTLRTVGERNDDHGFEIRSTRLPGLNQHEHVFSHTGIYFFNNDRRLRADFYRPVSSVSIDIVADGSSRHTIGRLEAYNAQGELLRMVRSRPLFGSSRQTITVTVPGEQIAYAVAYPDSNPANFPAGEEASSAFGRLDRLVFRQYEATAVSDENGEFTLGGLQPGAYNIVLQHESGAQLRDPLPSLPIQIQRYDNYRMDLVLHRNSPPRVESAQFTLPENSPAGTFVGTVIATDRDEDQTLQFALVDAETSPLQIDSATGDLFVRDPGPLDFEAAPEQFIEVLVTDSVGAVTAATLTLTLLDIDEPPVATLGQYSLYEDANPGSPVGRIFAYDPEHPSGPVQFRIVGGDAADAFAIGQHSGVITITDPSVIDFSAQNLLNLIVEVADSSVPPQLLTLQVPITVNDANDPPRIVSESLSVSEIAAVGTVVGQVQVEDRDLDQTHHFRIVGDAGPFAIDPSSGVITLSGSLNHDLVTHYDLSVQVIDNGLPPMGHQATLRIEVLAANRPPVLVQDAFTVAENSAAGTLIGVLVAEDRQGQEGFGFRSTRAADPLALFGGAVSVDPLSGQLRVAAGAVLDYESGPAVLSDQVVVTVDGQPVTVVDVTLAVLDVNEPPVVISDRLEVPEGLPAGRPFARVEVSDPEGHAVTLEVLQGAEQGLRIVQGDRLMILPGSPLDLNDQWPVEVVIGASDALGATTTATVQLFPGQPLPFGASINRVVGTTGRLLNFALPVEFRGDQIRSVRMLSPAGALPQGLTFDPASGRLSGVPTPQSVSQRQLQLEVVEFDGEVEVIKHALLEVAIHRSATPLHNAYRPMDVDNNGRVEPLDALRVINVLAAHGSGGADPLAGVVNHFVDTSGDNQVQPIDALRVLNHLARRPRAEGETELDAALWAGGSAEQRRDHQATDAALEQWLREPALF